MATHRKRDTSIAGFIIGLIIGGITSFIWGIGLITIGLVFLSFFKQPLLGGFLLFVFGVFWIALPVIVLIIDKVLGFPLILLLLPVGIFNMLSGFLFITACHNKGLRQKSQFVDYKV